MPKVPDSIGIKISELGDAGVIKENDVVPINAKTSEGVPFTKSTKINDLRQTLGFENAFLSVDAGLNGTVSGDVFFVYESAAKLWVLQYQNNDGVANPVLGYDNNQVRLPTSRQTKVLGEITGQKGYSRLGKVESFAALRSIVPEFDGQRILLQSYYEGGKNGAGEFIGRQGAGVDDGGIIASGTGFYWERVVGDSLLNLSYWGLDTGDDISGPLQKAADYVDGLIAKNSNFYSRPGIAINAGDYTATKTIILPSSLSVVALGNVQIRANNINGYIIKIQNKTATTNLNYCQHETLSSVGGMIYLVGMGKTVTTSHGLFVGNEIANQTQARNITLRNVTITNCYNSLTFGTINTYLFSATHCRFEQNNIGVNFPNQTSVDSGERMTFIDCIFGGNTAAHVYVNGPGSDLDFSECSFDYVSDSVLLISGSASAGYNAIKFTSCHFESWNKYLVEVTGTPNMCAVYFTACDFLPRTRSALTTIVNSPSRPLFKGNNIYVYLNGFEIRHEVKPYTEDIYMVDGNMSLTLNGYIKDPYYQIPSPNHLLNRGFNFGDETTGTVVSGTSSTLTRFTIPSIAGCNGTITDRSDGMGKQLTLTATNATNYITLLGSEFVPCKSRDRFGVSAAVNISDTTVNNRVSSGIWWYDETKTLISKVDISNAAMSTYFLDSTLPGYENGNSRYLSGLPATVRAPVGAAYAKVAVTFSAFAGVVNVSRVNLFRLDN